jgi:DNA-binding beta-propeller fold protein YncE
VRRSRPASSGSPPAPRGTWPGSLPAPPPLPALPDPCVAFGSAQDGAYGPAVSPDGTNLYVPCETLTVVFDRNPSSGALSSARSGPATGGLVFAPDGDTAWARRGGDGTRTLARAASGDLTVIADSATFVRILRVSPDGLFLYGLSYQGVLGVFDPDPLTGTITQLQEVDYPHYSVTAWAGALALSPDGAHVYVNARYPSESEGGAIDVYERDAITGLLTFVARVESGLGGMPSFTLASAIEISPDGAHVYMTDWFDQSVFVFSRAPATGLLTPVESIRGQSLPLLSFRGNEAVTSAAGSPLVVKTEEDGLVVFRRNPVLGRLFFVESFPIDQIPGIDQSESVVWAPDGGTLYTPDFAAGTVRIFEPRRACSAAPMATCSAATKAAIKLKRDPLGLRSKVLVKWTGASAMLGDPTAMAALALCLYDPAGVQLDVFVPPGGTCGVRPCWQTKASGFWYRSTALFPDGVQKVDLSGSGGVTTKAIVRGKGGSLPAVDLPIAGGVVAQLQSSDGGCIEATLAVPRRSDSTLFVGRIP